MDNDYENDYSDETEVENEESETTQKGPDLAAQLAAMQQQIQSLISMNQQQAQQVKKPKEQTLSDDQLAEIAKDPKALAQYMQGHLNRTTSKIEKEHKKLQFDSVAEQRFPMIKDNQEVRRAVAAKMKELVEVDGNYEWDSPTLLLRAAELVVPTVSGVLEVNKKRRDQSEDALDVSSGNTVRNRQSKKVSDNDPRLVFAKLLGIKDPKQLEKFKAGLGEYTPSARRKGKSLMV